MSNKCIKDNMYGRNFSTEARHNNNVLVADYIYWIACMVISTLQIKCPGHLFFQLI